MRTTPAAPRGVAAGLSPTVAAALTLAAVLSLVLALAAPPAAAAALEARLVPGALLTPRERPLPLVRVAAERGGELDLRLVAADGRTLAHASRTLRAGRARRIALTPTRLGRRRLGRCGSQRVRVIAVAADGTRRSARGRTTPDPIRCAPLRWPPPTLEQPRTIRLGDGFTQLRLEDGHDYVLRLPRGRKLGGTFVEGGRNVVVIGGHVTVPRDTATDQQRRALYFKGQTGTVHVEGVLIDGSGGGQGDGIALSAPEATVQIENVRIVDLQGSEQGTHADVVQPWGGVRELRIDRLSGSSHFQGLQLPVALGPIGAAFVRYADLRALPPATLRQGGGHMLWLTPPGSCTGYPVALEQVYVAARPGRGLGDSVWPGARDGSACAAVDGHGAARWPGLPVRGEVRAGRPSGGDFVPRWSVGERYRGPGYETGVEGVDPVVLSAFFESAVRAAACAVAALGCER